MEPITFWIATLTIIEACNLFLRLIKISMNQDPPLDPEIQKRLYS